MAFRLLRWRSVWSTVVPVVLVLCAIGAPAWAAIPMGPPSSFADLAEQVKHTVVNISTTQMVKENPMQPFMGPNSPFRDFFGDDFFKKRFGDTPQGQKTHALGSGFIIDSDGLILTNNHVVEKADEIKIKTEGGKEYDAKVVGRDSKTDLALIKVKPDADFPKPARLGDSTAIRVGDWVMAVGNPFGLGHSVTAGIISAKGRIIGAGPYDDFLQTDAAINPGNSGGPLFDMNGEVVGINSAIVAQAQGIGFAIPVNLAKDLLPQLKSGKVVRGWLGIIIQDITPDLAQSLGIKENKGVLVSDVVADTPAEKAGIKRGDVITGLNGKDIDNAHSLSMVVSMLPPESPATIRIERDGATKEIKLSIGTMPDDVDGSGVSSAKKTDVWGIGVQNVSPEIAGRFGWDAGENGVVVTEIQPGSPASDGKLRNGDLIKEINRRKIQNLRDYNQALQQLKKGESLLLLIKRGQHTFYVVLKAASE